MKRLCILPLVVLAAVCTFGCSDDDDPGRQDTGVIVDSGVTIDTGVSPDTGSSSSDGAMDSGTSEAGSAFSMVGSWKMTTPDFPTVIVLYYLTDAGWGAFDVSVDSGSNWNRTTLDAYTVTGVGGECVATLGYTETGKAPVTIDLQTKTSDSPLTCRGPLAGADAGFNGKTVDFERCGADWNVTTLCGHSPGLGAPTAPSS